MVTIYGFPALRDLRLVSGLRRAVAATAAQAGFRKGKC